MTNFCRPTRCATIASLIWLIAGLHTQALGQSVDRTENGRFQLAQMSVAEAQKFFGCKTTLSYDPSHGTQVSFKHPDGAIYLWYPGNPVILQGKWLIEPRPPVTQGDEGDAAICFHYGLNTYNPVTKRPGGRWNCMRADRLARRTLESVHGDVLGLARRAAAPFRLSRERTMIAELQRKIRAERRRQPMTASSSDCKAAS